MQNFQKINSNFPSWNLKIEQENEALPNGTLSYCKKFQIKKPGVFWNPLPPSPPQKKNKQQKKQVSR